MTGGEAVAAGLLANGIDTLFALPGVQLDHLFNALHGTQDRLRVINARHEQGVAYMALGAAQATGRPAAYACVPGPGFLNTAAALSTAYAVHAPVLALVGQLATSHIGAGGGELHELPDQSAIVRGLTRWSGIAYAPAEVPPLIEGAFRALRSGSAPAALELPADVLAGAAIVLEPHAAAPASPPTIDTDATRAAAELLATAKAPLIVVGIGAAEAGHELRAVAERLQAPVLSHLQGRGILASDHPLSIGMAEGARLWAHSDVILAVGTRFHMPRTVWRLRPGQRVVRIDLDPAQFGRGEPADVAIHADAKDALGALGPELERWGASPKSRHAELADLKRAVAAEFSQRLAPQMDFVRALPDEAIVVADYTQVGYVATAAFPVRRGRQLITPGYQGTLGFGYATALGAKVACPETPVIALCGDGGFLFTGNELATAARHGIAVIAVVFVDGAYGNVRRMQEEIHGGKIIASDLCNPDFVRLAESFGVEARRATGPGEFKVAIDWALQRRGPTLIEVPVGRMPDPWDLLEPDAS
ncbi:thiamine pyrophosphate-dependent enzyme [Mangrovicella endophytica]|uniref:thiamine pyrophosphate-dependent enzyme n=1 Tax=Mangrovicella endophytica TaxID=2066697 RepID=UPI0018E43E45|nr:thiamine pyrophosphate-dependent enzyme [Mangrovicella endophytica]